MIRQLLTALIFLCQPLSSFAGDSLTEIPVPGFQKTVKVFSNSIHEGNNPGSKTAMIAEDVKLENTTTRITISAGEPVDIVGGKVWAVNVSESSLNDERVSVSNFTGIMFWANTGTVRSVWLAPEMPETVALVKSNRGNLKCTLGRFVKNFSLFQDESVASCSFNAGNLVSMNDGRQVLATWLVFSEPNIIEVLRLRSGKVFASCPSHVGEASTLPGYYWLEKDETFSSAELDQKQTWAVEKLSTVSARAQSLGCALGYEFIVKIPDEDTLHDGLRIIADKIKSPADLDYCLQHGFERKDDYFVEDTYFKVGENLYDMRAGVVVSKPAGSHEKLLSYGNGCSIYGRAK